MQPLGNKILVRDIKEGEKKTAGGLIIPENAKQAYRKVVVEEKSPDSKTTLQKGDICLCLLGGVEIEDGLWLCNEGMLECKL